MYVGSIPVNLQYCAVLLRLADLIDLDPERTPKVLLDFIMLDVESRPSRPGDPVEEARLKSAEEWAKHRAILGYKVTPDEIRIEARCSHPAIQRGLREWCDYIDRERRDCRLVLQDNRGEIAGKYRLFLTNEVQKEYIESDGSYVYGDFRFQLDYDRIVHLLMGTELWGDPLLAIRELLQNALDACSHRLALSRRQHIDYTPRIAFRLTWSRDAREREAVLTCEDNGSGMDQYIVENYLMRIGRSYYRSADFQRQDLDFFPISQFGLGLMACFMLTDTVRIHTQHLDENQSKGAPLLIQIDSAERYVVLRPLGEHREGTAISLVFSDDMFMHPLEGRRGFRHPMMVIDVVHHALRSLALHLDIPIEVSHDEHRADIIEPGGYFIPQIDWEKLPCMKERSREFVFDCARKDTGGLAGKFRFLLPCDSEGRLCLGCSVESRFKMFVDRDGDLCLTTPGYEDKRMSLDFGIPNDWDTGEVRGVYRDRFGRKPPASEERYGGDTNPQLLEVVKSSFRWSQDGLFVGDLESPWGPHGRGGPRKDEEGGDSSPELFGLVDVPGLNAADIDIRGPWRVKLNVQRTRFLFGAESVGTFLDRFYALAADMWKRIVNEALESAEPEFVHGLLVGLFARSNGQLQHHLFKDMERPGKWSADSYASAYLTMVAGEKSSRNL